MRTSWNEQGIASGDEDVSMSISIFEFDNRRTHGYLGQTADSNDKYGFSIVRTPSF